MKLIIAVLALLSLTSSAGAEAERIGTATRIQTAVNGDYGSIIVKTPVHRNEQIRTSKSGLGEFVFRDGTKLAVGWGSVVKIDKFVFDDSRSIKKLSIKAAKGTFRWISGKSKSTAYSILTPAGTIGVRGTKFDFYVAADGTTAVVLLSGAAQFCGSGGCVQLRRRCDCVIAKRGQRPALSHASRRTLTALGNTRALPFLSGNQNLSGQFGASSGCGMNVSTLQSPDGNTPQKSAPNRSEPNKPDAPSRPDAPNHPDTPSRPDAPNHPDTPSRPDAPNHPDTPSTPNAPDRPADPGTPDTPNTPDAPTPDKRGHGFGDKNHNHTHDPQGKAKGHDKSNNGKGKGSDR